MNTNELNLLIVICSSLVMVATIITGAILWDSLDTAHEEVELQATMEKMAIFERLVAIHKINPIVLDCIIDSPIDRNSARFSLCTYAAGAITSEQISEIVTQMTKPVNLGE